MTKYLIVYAPNFTGDNNDFDSILNHLNAVQHVFVWDWKDLKTEVDNLANELQIDPHEIKIYEINSVRLENKYQYRSKKQTQLMYQEEKEIDYDDIPIIGESN